MYWRLMRLLEKMAVRVSVAKLFTFLNGTDVRRRRSGSMSRFSMNASTSRLRSHGKHAVEDLLSETVPA